ncbi:MAG TPA: phosphatidylglycerophosphatase A [Bryobacteraceae bacterium]|jgi:phosphatidylglycerophosphatase A|nr:phosphatidylglycerophosphatase A [Bryobacteraceae bacterium]
MKTSARSIAARWIATWFGCGYWPKGPGTAGSAAAIVVGLVLHHLWRTPAPAFGILAALLLVPGIWAAGEVARQAGKKDPQFVVVDEVIGQWVTLAGAAALNWKSWLAAFLLFRIFDIWKPFPVRRIESVPGGAGIVLDDVMAGVYAALVLFTLGWFNLY